MTTRERLIDMMVQHGMFPQDAESVFESVRPVIDAAVPDYRVTWDRPADEYPTPLYAVWWLYVKKAALAWIDANKPKAWFRAMFAE